MDTDQTEADICQKTHANGRAASQTCFNSTLVLIFSGESTPLEEKYWDREMATLYGTTDGEEGHKTGFFFFFFSASMRMRELAGNIGQPLGWDFYYYLGVFR